MVQQLTKHKTFHWVEELQQFYQMILSQNEEIGYFDLKEQKALAKYFVYVNKHRAKRLLHSAPYYYSRRI